MKLSVQNSNKFDKKGYFIKINDLGGTFLQKLANFADDICVINFFFVKFRKWSCKMMVTCKNIVGFLIEKYKNFAINFKIAGNITSLSKKANIIKFQKSWYEIKACCVRIHLA